jgi:vancomycin permeability regulator SanA
MQSVMESVIIPGRKTIKVVRVSGQRIRVVPRKQALVPLTTGQFYLCQGREFFIYRRIRAAINLYFPDQNPAYAYKEALLPGKTADHAYEESFAKAKL